MTAGQAPREAPKNKTALAARLRNAARAADLPEGRVQRQLGVIVVAELLGRVRSENGQQLFLVKGGSSIELRLGVAGSRTSKDLDAVFRGNFSLMYDAARDALVGGWNGFSAVVTPPEEIDAPGLATKPRRFKVAELALVRVAHHYGKKPGFVLLGGEEQSQGLVRHRVCPLAQQRRAHCRSHGRHSCVRVGRSRREDLAPRTACQLW